MIGAGFLFGAAGLTGICQPLTALDRISRRCLRDITAVVATTSLKMSISTSRLKRPELDRCLSRLKKGDTLVIYKLDRLGRSVHFLLGLVKTLGDRGINLVSLNDPIDTTTPVGVAIFQFCAVMAELEKGIIRERTKAGLQSARARGRVGGAPPKTNAQQRSAIVTMWESGKHSGREIANTYNISSATLYRILANHKKRQANERLHPPGKKQSDTPTPRRGSQ